MSLKTHVEFAERPIVFEEGCLVMDVKLVNVLHVITTHVITDT